MIELIFEEYFLLPFGYFSRKAIHQYANLAKEHEFLLSLVGLARKSVDIHRELASFFKQHAVSVLKDFTFSAN